jgi:hypothetical protein
LRTTRRVTTAERYTEQLVAAEAEVLSKVMTGPLKKSIQSFVAQHGKAYDLDRSKATKRYPRGKKKMCFNNSANLAFTFEDLVYVEGFARVKTLPILVHHAWCSPIDSTEVIDITTTHLVDYYGVAFSENYMEFHHSVRDNYATVLDNWHLGYPMLQMADHLVERALYQGGPDELLPEPERRELQALWSNVYSAVKAVRETK